MVSRVAIAFLLAVAVLSGGCVSPARPASGPAGTSVGSTTNTAVADQAIAQAFARRQTGVEVQDSGRVTRILPDDSNGSRHQRFIVKLASGQTVMIAHNIDIAPRLTPLAAGDTVEFLGEYAYNEQGGVIHWTHHDPSGQHATGWLKRGSVVVQ